MKFDVDKISDQKRLARGEQWLLARACLRARDGVHHRQWRVMTLSGEAPGGEFTAIRELMPKAQITAVDLSTAALEKAIEAGADEVICCDLSQTTDSPRSDGQTRNGPASALAGLRYDVVNLDFCGTPTDQMREVISVYRHIVEHFGVYMVTFAYGRDVIERWAGIVPTERRRLVRAAAMAQKTGLPTRTTRTIRVLDRLVSALDDTLAARVVWLSRGILADLRSVIVYRGHAMPMCALLFCSLRHPGEPSVVTLDEGDFELAVEHLSASRLYDCPEDRIAFFRRHAIAMSAVRTRQARQAS
jgi:hypothetical protein